MTDTSIFYGQIITLRPSNAQGLIILLTVIFFHAKQCNHHLDDRVA